ncbi:MAG: hypothetical protein Kow0089_00680 [Desulfobulbaceae bacterium]
MTAVKKETERFSPLLFSIFAALLLVEAVALLQSDAARQTPLFTALFFFLLTLWRPFFGLCLFCGAIPLLNGILLVQGFGDLSLPFTGVFVAWFTGRLVRGKTFSSLSTASFAANLLILLVLLNFLLFLVRVVEPPLPSRAWIDWFLYFPFVNQQDGLWQMNAMLILLKGLFSFRMFELEMADQRNWRSLLPVFHLQVAGIAVFALGQYLGLVQVEIPGVRYQGVFLPFNDIHSFGSWGVFLFGMYGFLFLQALQSGWEGKRKETVAYGGIAVLQLLLCLLSSSRMAWLALALTACALVFTTIRNRKVWLYMFLAVLIVTAAGTLSAPALRRADHPTLKRLGTMFQPSRITREESVQVRVELWRRALAMAREYPLTGVGTGNLYRHSPEYRTRSAGKWDMENAHDYYLQVLAELGIPGLALFLLTVFSLFGRQGGAGSGQGGQSAVSVTPLRFGLAAYLLTMLTGHALLLSSHQLLFWSAAGMVSARRGRAVVPLGGSTVIKPVGMLFLLLYLAGWAWGLGSGHPRTISREYGLYSPENWNGKAMRWMAGRARFFLPAETRSLDLHVEAQPFNSSGPQGLILTILVDGRERDRVRFEGAGSRDLHYALGDVGPDRGVRVDLQVDKTFRPRDIGLNRDTRHLGVALAVTARPPAPFPGRMVK